MVIHCCHVHAPPVFVSRVVTPYPSRLGDITAFATSLERVPRRYFPLFFPPVLAKLVALSPLANANVATTACQEELEAIGDFLTKVLTE